MPLPGTGGVLAILAHPDDESMGCGGLLARHARASIPVHLLCLTRGGEGWRGKPEGAREVGLFRLTSFTSPLTSCTTDGSPSRLVAISIATQEPGSDQRMRLHVA